MMTERVDTIVVGGGVVGLAVARALTQAGREVLVLEANPAIGQETSSRNSEVLHAGLYYRPGSLKALSCVRGQALLYDYCLERGIPHQRCGKLVVATLNTQVPELHRLLENARASGVQSLRWLDREQAQAMEPACRVEAALWSPDTGTIDSHALMLALQGDCEAGGGGVVLNSRAIGGTVTGAGIELEVDSGERLRLQARNVINAAGLWAPELARRLAGLPASQVPVSHFVRGHYYTYGARSPFSHLVYPVPEPEGLGVHGTLDLGGRLRFGPDAEYIDRVDYQFDDSRRDRFSAAIREWFPDLDETRLQAGYVGIRPRLAGPGQGFSDFVVAGPAQHGIPGLVNLFGIESPGLTACLALADEVVAALARGASL